MKKKLFIILALLFLFPVLAFGTPISADLTGFRSTAVGGGLIGTDGWNGSVLDNVFGISWNISFDGTDEYTYEYTFFGDGLSQNALSHWILEVTNPSKLDEFDMVGSTPSISDGPTTFYKNGPSNPYMPADIYGIKWDSSANSFSFNTDKDPVWGDLYAKDGREGGTKIFATAYNIGFGTEPIAGGDFTNWIARPNGGTAPIPEPATMLLLGTGLIGLAGVGRKKLMGKKLTK